MPRVSTPEFEGWFQLESLIMRSPSNSLSAWNLKIFECIPPPFLSNGVTFVTNTLDPSDDLFHAPCSWIYNADFCPSPPESTSLDSIVGNWQVLALISLFLKHFPFLFICVYRLWALPLSGVAQKVVHGDLLASIMAAEAVDEDSTCRRTISDSQHNNFSLFSNVRDLTITGGSFALIAEPNYRPSYTFGNSFSSK